MADHDQPDYRGLILRDDRFNAANATISPATQQGGAKVGEPRVVVGEGHMDLEAVGTSVPDKNYDIKCVKPGYANGTKTGGRFIWKYQEETDASYRGWWPFTTVTSCKVWATALRTKIPMAWPHAITSKDGFVHMVYAEVTTTTRDLYVATLNPATDTWSTVNFTDQVFGVTSNYAPPSTLVELPSGRLLLITHELDTYWSDDRGANWQIAQSATATASKDFGSVDPDIVTINSWINVRAVYHNGYITLIREVQGPVSSVKHFETDHYVSKDFGVSWELIDRWQPDRVSVTGSGTSVANVYDAKLVVDALDQPLLIYADKPGSTDADRVLKAGRKLTPYSSFVDDPDFDTTLQLEDNETAGRFHCLVDYEGFLTVIYQGGRTTSPNELYEGKTNVRRYNMRDLSLYIDESRSNGAIQHVSDVGPSDTQFALLMQDGPITPPWAIGNGVELINMSTATAYKAGILLFTHGYTKNEAGTQNDGRGATLQITLGGYQNLDHSLRGYYTWLPTETPDNIATDYSLISATAFGGPPANTNFSITLDGCEFASTSGAHAFGLASGFVTCIFARYRGKTNASVTFGEINNNYATIYVNGVEVRLGKEEAQVWDATSGYGVATAISSVLTLTDEDRDWAVTWEQDGANYEAVVYYKLPSEQVWTKVTTTASLSATPNTASGQNWFGNWDSGTYTSVWNFVTFMQKVAPIGNEWEKTDYRPYWLYGRPFSLYPTYLDSGWNIESKGAVAFVGDSWQSETDYAHPMRLIHPEIAPSPRVDWRSADDDTEVTIEWNPAAGQITRPLNTSIGVHLNKINFKLAYFEGWNGSTWTTLGTIDTSSEFSGLKYTRHGNVIIPDTTNATAGGRYLKLDELAGARVVLDPGGGSESHHQIAHNTEGVFASDPPNAVPKFAQLLLTGDVSGAPASDTLDIYEETATLLIHTALSTYSKYRLRIPAQTTLEEYFTIGTCLIGPVVLFGQDYSWGRTIANEPNQEITTGRAGDRLVEELGPIRRTVQFAWTEGIDSTDVSGTPSTSFDYLSAGTANGWGVRADPWTVAGSLYRLRGAYEPTVYLPRIPDANAASTQIILGRDRHIYGRVVSPVTQQTILGDDEETEVIAINQVTIEEEL
jgi:hypothetical protein